MKRHILKESNNCILSEAFLADTSSKRKERRKLMLGKCYDCHQAVNTDISENFAGSLCCSCQVHHIKDTSALPHTRRKKKKRNEKQIALDV